MNFYNARVISGLSIKTICDGLDISKRQYTRIENGEVQFNIDFVRKFSNLTGISSNYILELINEPLPIVIGKDLNKKHYMN